MRKNVVLGVLVLVVAASVSLGTTYNFPTDGTFGTNPSGQWMLYTAPETWSTAGDLTAAADGGGGQWYSSSTDYPIYKQYSENKWAISENPSWSDAAVLAFTAPQIGKYSLNLGIYSVSEYIPWSESRPGIIENLKVAVATNNSSPAQVLWSNIRYWTSDGSAFDDLSTESGVQNIQLNAGEKILISMDLAAYPNYGKIGTFIKAGGSGGAGNVGGSIEYVPEPATLGLLSLGLFMLKRRK